MNQKSIPIISARDLSDPATRDQLDQACRDWGFFQLVDHGISRPVSDGLMQASRDFFHLPAGEKRKISRTSENQWGFYDQELTKNRLDCKEIYDFGPRDGKKLVPQWPATLPGFPAAVYDFYQEAESLSLSLLGAISRNLGMPADWLARYFQPRHSSFLRLNYYPVTDDSVSPAGLVAAGDGQLGINHHTDAGALTILLQDEHPGLEVYRNGQWHLVAPRPDALVVNIGDIVQVWSNDRYKASLHRVVASTKAERFSAPFFFNPSYQTDYYPLPSTVALCRPARYRSINWGEFRRLRAAGDYADRGTEIQISHYQVNGGSEHAVY